MGTSILLLGCGNLGKTLLHGWLQPEAEATKVRITVVQPSLSAQSLFVPFYPSHVSFVSTPQSLPPSFMPDVVVIAVKPQKIPEVLPEYLPLLEKALVISLAAGVSVESLRTYMGENDKVVRLMPTVAMAVGESVTLAFAPPSSPPGSRQGLWQQSPSLQNFVETLFQKTGSLTWLEQEAAFDLLSPLSGSGPAYFFLMAEILVECVVKDFGVSEALARELIQKTLKGSALLAEKERNFGKLALSVASKGGITEKALEILGPSLRTSFPLAYQAALTRLKELSK